MHEKHWVLLCQLSLWVLLGAYRNSKDKLLVYEILQNAESLSYSWHMSNMQLCLVKYQRNLLNLISNVNQSENILKIIWYIII